jgi:hypothetical protein
MFICQIHFNYSLKIELKAELQYLSKIVLSVEIQMLNSNLGLNF